MTEYDDYEDAEYLRYPTQRQVFLGLLPYAVAGLVAIGTAAWLLMSEASAHSFYDAVCCSGDSETGDCQPIADSTVKPIDGGVQITLVPGDHHMVTRVHVFQIPQTQVRPSKDGRWHVCLYPTEDRVQCVYGPPYGS